MSRKYFGTDGIRGTVGQAPITADFAFGQVNRNRGSNARPHMP